jgi:hypothetical protein
MASRLKLAGWIAVAALGFQVSASSAATDGRLVVGGTVLDFDRRIVKLRTKDGILRVPRGKVLKEDLLRPGRKAYAVVSVNDLYRLN